MKVSVLGGGLTGLSAAHFLLKRPGIVSEVVVHESSSRLGGWIETTRHRDGALYEHGPRTVRASGGPGAATLRLVEELGLEPKLRVVKAGHPSTVNRLVYADGTLHRLPYAFSGLFKRTPPFRRPMAVAALRELFVPPKICPDDSLFGFVARRFGEDVATFAADPLARGICAGDAKEISADAFVSGPAFRREQSDGGVLRSLIKEKLGMGRYEAPSEGAAEKGSELVRRSREEKWAVWSLEGGLSTLVEALADELRREGVEIRTGSPVAAISVSRNGGASVDGERTDRVLAALPAFAAAELLGSEHAELRALLASVPYVTVAVVNVEFPGKVDLVCGEGFGLLVPSNQLDSKVLGIIFDTCILPQGERTVFTAMIGGRWFEQLFGRNPAEEELEEVAVSEIRRLLRIGSIPIRVACKIQRDCIAQYTIGHNLRLKEMREYVEENRLPLSLLGNAFDGVGINYAVTSAYDQVNRMFNSK